MRQAFGKGRRSSASGLCRLRNIGPTSARWLEAVGVGGRGALEELGAVEVFQRVRDAGFEPSLNLLYALQGALLDAAWTEVLPEIKARLRAAVRAG